MDRDRRTRLVSTLLIAAAACTAAWAASPPVHIAPVKNRAPLAASVFYPLPLTSVKPEGWLKRQLQIQANGLTGHLEDFWPDLGPQSAWLGGSGEGWERGPYYLDGLLPLAYLLEDQKLIAKSKKWVEWTLTHQRPDGGIGPEKNLDWWPNFIMLKVLTQYQEATGDERVIPLMKKYFAYQAANLDKRPLHEWAVFRWYEEVLSVLWLYNRTGDESLLALARKLHDQGHDWQAQFANFRYTSKLTNKSDIGLATHGVNNAMALKAPALWYLLTGKGEDKASALDMLAKLDRYHGLPNGMFSSTEHYGGRDPSQGIELCAVVEEQFSLELESGILGEAALADRLEKITYNALPATITADMWAHQYDQQPNQVMCSLSKRSWTSNGPESNLFGLEPNFGCCTANMHQGWPKFASHLWMGTANDGIAAIAYAPSRVRTLVKGKVAVSINEKTDYPFRDRILLTVDPEAAVAFPLVLRIPGWAADAKVAVNGQAVSGVQPGSFLTIDRQWTKGDKVELTFPMKIRVTRDFNDSAVVERGPLLYSLRIDETWRKLKQTGPASDWEVFPATPWNYGLSVNLDRPEQSFTVEEKPVGNQPFSHSEPPVLLMAKGRRLPEWQLVDDSAGPLPASPVKTKQPEETLMLIPYGAAKLRVTAFPVLPTGTTVN